VIQKKNKLLDIYVQIAMLRNIYIVEEYIIVKTIVFLFFRSPLFIKRKID